MLSHALAPARFLRALVIAAALTTVIAMAAPAAHASALNLRTCSAMPGGVNVVLPDGSAWVDLAGCTLDVPAAGTAVVYATAGAGHSTVSYVAAGRLQVNGIIRPGDSRAHILGVGSDYTGTDRSLALVDAIPVGAGSLTFTMQGQLREQVGGNGRAYNPSIWVLFVPNGSPVRVCSSLRGDTNLAVPWLSVKANECTIDAPQAGRILSLWTGSPNFVSNSDFPVSTELRGPDTFPIAGTERISTLSLTRRHAPIASTAMVDVAAGAATMSAWAELVEEDPTDGSLSRSSLVSIYVPNGYSRAQLCHSLVSTSWALLPRWGLDTNYSAPCELNPTGPGQTLFAATSASGPPDTATTFNEVWMRPSLNNFTIPNLQRWSDTSGWAGIATSGTDAVDGPGLRSYRTTTAHGFGDDAVPGIGGGFAGLFVSAVDTTGPAVRVTAAPTGRVPGSTASVSFSGDADTVSFTCSLDNAAPSACTSPLRLTGLTRGNHSLAIRATDDVGNVGAPTTASWITTIAPVAASIKVTGPLALAAAARTKATTVTFRTAEPRVKVVGQVEVTAAVARSLRLPIRRSRTHLVIGTGSVTTDAAGAKTVRIRFTTPAARALSRRASARTVRAVPARVRLSLTAGGNSATYFKAFTYRRR